MKGALWIGLWKYNLGDSCDLDWQYDNSLDDASKEVCRVKWLGGVKPSETMPLHLAGVEVLYACGLCVWSATVWCSCWKYQRMDDGSDPEDGWVTEAEITMPLRAVETEAEGSGEDEEATLLQEAPSCESYLGSVSDDPFIQDPPRVFKEYDHPAGQGLESSSHDDSARRGSNCSDINDNPEALCAIGDDADNRPMKDLTPLEQVLERAKQLKEGMQCARIANHDRLLRERLVHIRRATQVLHKLRKQRSAANALNNLDTDGRRASAPQTSVIGGAPPIPHSSDTLWGASSLPAGLDSASSEPVDPAIAEATNPLLHMMAGRDPLQPLSVPSTALDTVLEITSQVSTLAISSHTCVHFLAMFPKPPFTNMV